MSSAHIRLRHEPVVAQIDAHCLEPGATIDIRLIAAAPDTRTIKFERVS